MFKTKFQKRILLIFLIAALVLSFSAPFAPSVHTFALQGLHQGAQTVLNWQTQEYQSISTENFMIKYTAPDEIILPEASALLEDYYAQVQTLLGYTETTADKTLVVIYPDREALNGSIGMWGDKSTAGVYWAGAIRLLSPRAWSEGANREELLQTLQQDLPVSHELTHLIIDEWTGGNYSRWLTEGLAQYVEKEVAGFTLAEPDAAAKENPYTLAVLESGFDSRPDERLAYWQSLQTVTYLLDYYGPDKMRELLDTLSEGATTEEAIEAIYGLTYAELERESL